jgi:putative SOS response-associated peptidase YedK
MTRHSRSLRSYDGLLKTFCRLIMDANVQAAKVYGRMPVILTGNTVNVWLDRSLKDLRPLADLLKPAPVKRLAALRALGSGRNEVNPSSAFLGKKFAIAP